MSIRYINIIKSHLKGVKNTFQDIAEEWLTNVEDMPMKSAYKQILKLTYIMAIRSA